MERSALLALHTAARARLGPGDPPALLTYGDVPAEYRSALADCALFDETDRGRIELTGADAVSFLQRLLSSDVSSLQSGHGQRSLLLSSKGKVMFDFDLFRGESSLWISTPPGCEKALADALETYHFAEKVQIQPSAGHAPVSVCGPRAGEILRQVTEAEAPEHDLGWTSGRWAGGELVVARVPVAGSTGLRLDAGPEHASQLWEALRNAGATPTGIVVRDILRVEAGAALYGQDIDLGVYPQEARLESAISLTKGCYVGQEVVAKIDTYGGLNKRLVALRISHDDPVARGTRLFRDEEGERRDLGVITSWAYSFAVDAGLVLAYVKRRHQKPGTIFQLDDTDARAEIVPIPVRAGALPVTGEFE